MLIAKRRGISFNTEILVLWLGGKHLSPESSKVCYLSLKEHAVIWPLKEREAGDDLVSIAYGSHYFIFLSITLNW